MTEWSGGEMWRVLIVEDDPDISSLIANALTTLGIECVVATDIDEARDHFEPERFALVITDYEVPGGGARAFVHAVREYDLDVPVLLVSGRMDKKALAAMIRESVDEYIEKPIDLPTLMAAVNRLIRLGGGRRQMRQRAAHLLRISSQVKVGAATEAILQNLVQAVGEITPFRRAVIALVSGPDQPMKIEASFGVYPEGQLWDWDLRASFERGYKFDIASLVPADSSRSRSGKFSQVRARNDSWHDGDQILVQIQSQDRLLGYIRVWNPSDGARPTEMTMRMLSLLGHNVANALENREMYRRQLRLNARLRVLGELVKTALKKSDVRLIKRMLSDIAVNRFGHSFACFIEKVSDQTYVVDSVTCRNLSDYAEEYAFGEKEIVRLRSIETNRSIFEQKRVDGGSSLVRNRLTSSIAIPIFTGEMLRHIFVVEDDHVSSFDETEVMSFTAFADQIGLVWQTLLYQKYLENTATELKESYAQLKEANDLNIRLQEIVKRYVPRSTWESALQSSESEDLQRIEDVADRAVMFIDIVGFTTISEHASPKQIVEMLNVCFTVMSSIVAQSSGEIIKYIGDGMLAYFQTPRDAIRAADDIVKSQARLNRELKRASLDLEIALRAGVAYGPVILAHVGPIYHQDRTLLGDTVNTASRLEAAARAGTALLDLQVLPEGDDPGDYGLVRMPSIQVRGKLKRISVMTFARDEHLYREEPAIEGHTRTAG